MLDLDGFDLKRNGTPKEKKSQTNAPKKYSSLSVLCKGISDFRDILQLFNKNVFWVITSNLS